MVVTCWNFCNLVDLVEALVWACKRWECRPRPGHYWWPAPRVSGRTLARLCCWTSLVERLSKGLRILGGYKTQKMIENLAFMCQIKSRSRTSFFPFNVQKLHSIFPKNFGVRLEHFFPHMVCNKVKMSHISETVTSIAAKKESRSFPWFPFEQNTHRPVSWLWVSLSRHADISSYDCWVAY